MAFKKGGYDSYMFLKEAEDSIKFGLAKFMMHQDYKCATLFFDAFTHRAIESILGLPLKEIARRTRKYFLKVKALKKSLNTILRKATK